MRMLIDAATRQSGKRAVVVCRNNLVLEKLVGGVVDAAIGWDRGEAGFVFKRNVGKRHSKATLYKILDSAEYDLTLSQFLDGAPRIRG